MYNVHNAGMENFNKKYPNPISLKPNIDLQVMYNV